MRRRGEEVKREFLSAPTVRKFAASVWEEVKGEPKGLDSSATAVSAVARSRQLHRLASLAEREYLYEGDGE